MRRLILLVALAPLPLSPFVAAPAGELPRSKPDSVGLDPAKLGALKPALQKTVDEGKLAGAVALTARRGKVADVTVVGYRDLVTKVPMTENTIFAIMSMSKPITCVAAMTLVEQGKIGLDDPVGKYLPELKDLRVRGDAKNDTDKEIATVPAKRPVRVRDLLAHTSGFAYGSLLSDPRLRDMYVHAGVEAPGQKTIASMVERLARVPLAHQPGEGWTYGLSHDVLGRVIEVASGQRFDVYLKDKVFTPLDMDDTSFFVPSTKQDRLATAYNASGHALSALPRTYGNETYFSGGGGLFSTARDYARFCQMLLDRGELEGVHVLKPETIALMTANQIGDIDAKIQGTDIGKYGLGFGVTWTGGTDGAKPILTGYGWAGFYSTQFRIQPERELVTVFMTQVLPTNLTIANEMFLPMVESAVGK
jgi:CubicO group peptidase (beta-lactamase class C family)